MSALSFGQGSLKLCLAGDPPISGLVQTTWMISGKENFTYNLLATEISDPSKRLPWLQSRFPFGGTSSEDQGVLNTIHSQDQQNSFCYDDSSMSSSQTSPPRENVQTKSTLGRQGDPHRSAQRLIALRSSWDCSLAGLGRQGVRCVTWVVMKTHPTLPDIVMPMPRGSCGDMAQLCPQTT